MKVMWKLYECFKLGKGLPDLTLFLPLASITPISFMAVCVASVNSLNFLMCHV